MDDEPRMIFAENLKRLEDEKGISPADIARYLNCSPSTVSEWRSGKKYPRPDKMQRLANLLGVKMSDLTSRHDERESDDAIKFALFGGTADVTDEMMEEIRQYAKFVKMKYGEKK